MFNLELACHGVSWRRDVGEALEYLQTERHTLRLEPDRAQLLLELAAKAYCDLARQQATAAVPLSRLSRRPSLLSWLTGVPKVHYNV